MGSDGSRGEGVGPKTLEVIDVIKAYPLEVQADLSRYHKIRIRDWWRGKVTSQELYAYILHLPEDSATKAVFRDGDWHEDKYLSVRLINELMCYRADFVSSNGGDMKPNLILSPKQLAAKAAERQQYLDLRQMMLAQMRGEFVPPTRDVHFETEDRKGIGIQDPPAPT